jgi:hypothetical protein
MTTTSMFTTGDRVDVTIRGARFERRDEHHVDVYLAGIDSPICVPTVDDDGEPLDAVTVGHHVPVVRPGEVWQARDTGALFLCTQLDDNPPQLIAADQHAYDPQAVVDHWGPIDCIASSAYVDPAPPEQRPHPDAVLVSVVDVRLFDRVFNAGTWHNVLGDENPDGKMAEHRRFYTDHASAGLLYQYTDDVWVLRAAAAPIYAAVEPWAPPAPDAAWSGFLRPDDEPQPGDKVLDLPTIDQVAPAVLLDEPATETPELAR